MRYFKRSAESELGEGWVWLEFDGEQPRRQVERYGRRWFSSRKRHHIELGPGLIDQPLSETEVGLEQEVSAEEFEDAWQQSGDNA